MLQNVRQEGRDAHTQAHPHTHTHTHTRTHTHTHKDNVNSFRCHQRAIDPIQTYRRVNEPYCFINGCYSLDWWTDCNILIGNKSALLCQFLIGLCVFKHKLGQHTACLFLTHPRELARRAKKKKKTVKIGCNLSWETSQLEINYCTKDINSHTVANLTERERERERENSHVTGYETKCKWEQRIYPYIVTEKVFEPVKPFDDYKNTLGCQAATKSLQDIHSKHKHNLKIDIPYFFTGLVHLNMQRGKGATRRGPFSKIRLIAYL